MATPDAWDDGWEAAADKPSETAPKKPSSKITKAQRRAQQLEFNRRLWAEAEGPGQPNYFLETRGVVPNPADFKPPPRLLSRKAPPTPAELNGGGAGGSSDEGDEDGKDKKKQLMVEEQRVLAAEKREEKQRKYEERRLELFGTAASTTTMKAAQGSAASSPGETPPGSRSATPNRSRGRGGGGRKAEHQQRPSSSTSSLSLKPSGIAPGPAPSPTGKKELYDPKYTPKPETASASPKKSQSRENVIAPSEHREDMMVVGEVALDLRRGVEGLAHEWETQKPES